MSRLSKFRRGSSTYTCNVCKKLTRDTGIGERGCDLCADCYEIAGEENTISDYGLESPEGQRALETIKKVVARRPELASTTDYV